jgi:hypothetical protein
VACRRRNTQLVEADTDWPRIARSLGLPLIIKPDREGSTIGITKVSVVNDLPAAYALAAKYDSLVLAEEFVAGQELTASVLGQRALPLVRIDAPQGNYDYHNKYFTDATKYYCPAGVRASLEDEIQRLTLKAFQVLGCAGWGRADLILRSDGTFSFLEMNTSPGMTGHSLVPMAAKQAGISFADLCVTILRARMWDDPRQLNAVAAFVMVLAFAAICWSALSWLVRQPAFAFHEVHVQGSAGARQSRACRGGDPRRALRHVLHHGSRQEPCRADARCPGCATSRCGGNGHAGSKSPSRNTFRLRAGTTPR